MNQSFSLLPNEELKELNQKLDEILSYIQSNSKGNATEVIGGKWVPEHEARRITGKKGTTLWKMRTSGELTFTKLNNRVYYDIESILSLLEKNKQEAFK